MLCVSISDVCNYKLTSVHFQGATACHVKQESLFTKHKESEKLLLYFLNCNKVSKLSYFPETRMSILST